MIFSYRHVRISGARKSKATSAATRSVAATSAMVTIVLDSGREQAASSPQASPARAPNQPVATAETSKRHSDENRLIRREPSQISDPRAADAKAEQQKRHDAARGGRNRRQNAAHRHELLCLPGCRVGHCDRVRELSGCVHRYRPLIAQQTFRIL